MERFNSFFVINMLWSAKFYKLVKKKISCVVLAIQIDRWSKCHLTSMELISMMQKGIKINIFCMFFFQRYSFECDAVDIQNQRCIIPELFTYTFFFSIECMYVNDEIFTKTEMLNSRGMNTEEWKKKFLSFNQQQQKSACFFFNANLSWVMR